MDNQEHIKQMESALSLIWDRLKQIQTSPDNNDLQQTLAILMRQVRDMEDGVDQLAVEIGLREWEED